MSSATSVAQTSAFDELLDAHRRGGVDAALDRLVERLRQEKRHHELFEALKMRLRRRIGLPLLWQDSAEELDEATRSQLEAGLLDACREVGMLLLAEGNVREGWMYLRPVGDAKAVSKALQKIEVDEDNVEDLIAVALHEGVDVGLGYKLALEHYGTCNCITIFESELSRRRRKDQQAAASLLVDHVHRDLLASVRSDIAHRTGAEPKEQTLAALLADRPWLFADNTFHIDTTHLAATVRFARSLDDPRLLRLALDLTEYGRRLNPQFQYQGDDPFTDLYPSHGLYFRALLGEDADEALTHFRQRADAVNPQEQGTGPIEVYIDLLSRMGRVEEALTEAIRLVPAGVQTWGLAPSLFELSQRQGSFDRMLEHCREKNDLLGFAAALAQR